MSDHREAGSAALRRGSPPRPGPACTLPSPATALGAQNAPALSHGAGHAQPGLLGCLLVPPTSEHLLRRRPAWALRRLLPRQPAACPLPGSSANVCGWGQRLGFEARMGGSLSGCNLWCPMDGGRPVRAEATPRGEGRWPTRGDHCTPAAPGTRMWTVTTDLSHAQGGHCAELAAGTGGRGDVAEPWRPRGREEVTAQEQSGGPGGDSSEGRGRLLNLPQRSVA